MHFRRVKAITNLFARFPQLLALFAFVFCTWSTEGLGITSYLRPTGGLMMQPASQFHHAVYGITADIANEAESFVGRVVYLERPKFRANGFEDQDSGLFALVGTRVTKGKNHGLSAFIGGGRMGGYIKETSGDTSLGSYGASSRSYKLNGLTASLEYAGKWKVLSGSLGHQTFIGYGSKDQRDAYVAWPFNFLFATVGIGL